MYESKEEEKRRREIERREEIYIEEYALCARRRRSGTQSARLTGPYMFIILLNEQVLMLGSSGNVNLGLSWMQMLDPEGY